ncbi:hypothetical protein WN55_05507 [Dufourea novaeangliae]|uniref:Reverse transcriptase zinc-binding domain-containing protein n=1 Tax=Dufourea novaeangliae TaxID=178035 RepID=A0A154PMM2_DUFNO|nr:hypothetical protein WN55_05507 [Dufourea novaeangliae]
MTKIRGRRRRREDTRRVAGLLTGHAILKHHLARMGEVQDERCEFCDEVVAESAEHILMRCQGLMEPRFKKLRKAILDEDDVPQLAIRGLQEFAQGGGSEKRKERIRWDKGGRGERVITR